MSLRVEVSSAATSDLVRAARYIARHNFAAAQRLILEVEATFERLATSPGTGTLLRFRKPSLAGMRVISVSGFENYLVFFKHEGDSIEIVRLLHGARDWRRILNR